MRSRYNEQTCLGKPICRRGQCRFKKRDLYPCIAFFLLRLDPTIIKGHNCRSSFPKSIQSFIFKKYAQILSIVISKLLKLSIVEGQFPDILKEARVIQIFKAGLREIINNYQPISSLGVLSKNFEKLMCNGLNNYSS